MTILRGKEKMTKVKQSEINSCLVILNKLIEGLKIQVEKVNPQLHLEPPFVVQDPIRKAFYIQYLEVIHDVIEALEKLLDIAPPIDGDWSEYTDFVEIVNQSIMENPEKTCVLTHNAILTFRLDCKGINLAAVNGQCVWSYVVDEMVKIAGITPMEFFTIPGHEKINAVYGL